MPTLKPAFFCLAALLWCWSCGTGASQYVQRGDTFFAKAQYTDAEINYRKAIQKDRNSGNAYFGLGNTLIKQSKIQEAYASLFHAAELLPKRDDVVSALGNVSLIAYLQTHGSGYYDQLVKISTRLLKDDPESYDGLRLKGDTAMLDRHYAEAVALLTRADTAKPMQEDVVVSLIQCLIQNNQGPEAEKTGLSYIETKHPAGITYDILYQYFMAANRLADAEAVLKKRVANNPEVTEDRLALAAHYAKQRDEVNLNAVIQELADLKRFPNSLIDIGNFYLSTNRVEAAVETFQKGITADPNNKLNYQKRLVETFISHGKPDRAAPLIQEILKGHSDDFDIRLIRAGIEVDSGDSKKLDLGLKELQALTKERPLSALALFNLGKAELRSGDKARALVEFQAALRIDPRLLEARVLAANVCLELNNYQQAGQYADEVLQLSPANPLARLIKIKSLTGIGSLSTAIVEANRLDKDFPKEVEPKLEVGSLLMIQKRFSEAETLFRSVYAADRKPRALRGLIEAMYAQNHFEAAFQLVNEVWTKEKTPEVQPLLADAALKTNRFDLGIQEYTALAKAEPKSFLYHNRLGNAYMAQGNMTEAVNQFQIAKRLAPKDSNVHAMLALSLQSAKRYAEAQQAYREALVLDPASPALMNNLAYLIAETNGNLDEALRLAQEASRLQPNNSALADTVGWVYLKKNMADNAIEVFSRVVKGTPAIPVYRYHLATAFLQKGDKAAAKRQLQAALAGKPDKAEEAQISELLAKTL